MTQQSGGIELAHAAAMPAPQGGALPTGLEWQALDRMAHTLADSSLVPYKLRGKPGDVAVILLAAREYGIPPLMALSKLPVVNGKPAPMGELMQALILRAGHRMTATFRNPDGSTYGGGQITPGHYGEAVYRRRDWTEDESLRFTIAEAVTAGLVRILDDGSLAAYDDKNRPLPWMQYTPNMARWRAVANAARINFADVLMGLSYLPEELGAVVDAEGMPIEGEVVEQPRQRHADGSSLGQRTAQEAADRLPEFVGPLEVLDNVLRHAEENDYADETVRTPDGPLALRNAIQRRREWLAANTVAGEAERQQPAQPAPGTVDSDGIEEAEVVEPATAPEAPQEAASAPETAQDTPAEAPAQETPEEAAYDVAREVLMCRDVELLRTYYRGTGDLKAINVLPVVDDGDLHTLGVDPRVPALTLGSLLIAASKYVEGAGIAIRDPEPERAFDGPAPAADGDDPWAGDSTATAEGWARQHGEQQP